MLILKEIICNRFQNLRRLHTCIHTKETFVTKSLHLTKHGTPTDVLQMKEDNISPTNTKQVLIKIIASPIHPSDIDYIKGLKPPSCKVEALFPVIPGSECVAEVVSLGTNVQNLCVGQRVIVPFADTISKRGTWSTYALYDAEDLFAIPDDIDIPEAATLAISPCVAYRLLKDFITLNPGDSVLFNGGKSSVGQALHQLCRAWDLQSFSVRRAEAQTSEEELRLLGATKTFTLRELVETSVFDDGTYPKPRMTLSITSRSSSKKLGKFLDPNGVMIVYGCMKGYRTAIVTATQIFNDFVQRPFWIRRWSKDDIKADELKEMFTDLLDLIRNKKFHVPDVQLVPFKDYRDAFGELGKLKQNITTRFLLDMRCEN